MYVKKKTTYAQVYSSLQFYNKHIFSIHYVYDRLYVYGRYLTKPQALLI